LAEQQADWAIAGIAGQDFNLAHFSTIEGERTNLTDNGFAIEDVFASAGDRIDVESEMPPCPWIHVIARKMTK
jgi:hypothetical protein